jgi:adenine-specific DNA-methyltransferase
MEGFMAGRTGERKYFKSADFEDRWRLSDLTKQTTKDERPNSYFPLINPKNGESFPANPNRTWSITKDTFPEYYEKGKIVFPGDYDFLKIKMPAFRVFESEDKKKALLKHGTEEIRMSVSTYLPEKSIGRTEHGSEEIRDLFDSQVFSFPKPTSLIRFFLENLGQKDSVVLDFFAGSGTTGHAVMAQNITDGGTRKYILIQLPEPLNPDNKNKKVASDYCDKLGKPRNLAELAKERLRRAHKRLDLSKKTAGQDYGFRVFKLQKSNFQEWNEYTGSDISELMELFSKQENTLASEWDEEALLTEIILQEGFPLSSSREKVVSVKENTVWKFTSHTCEHSLYICLDKSIKSKALESIPLTGKDIFICLDNAVRDEEKVKLSDKGLIKTI